MNRWLRNNNLLNVRTPGTKHTHTLMSGGVISVPDEEYDTFLHLYAEEVRMGNSNLTLSELRSDPLFRMYFDVDLLDENVLTEDFYMRMSGVIQDVIKTYYPSGTEEDVFKCVICTTPTKEVEKNGVKFIKNGYHIIYPNLNVNLEQAFQLRYNIVYKLEEKLGARKISENTWSDAIDRAPYNNGLKMCGSFKMVKCTACKNKNISDMKEKESLLKEISENRKKVHPRDPGYDYKNMDDISSIERKDLVLEKLFYSYTAISGYNTCCICRNRGRYIEDRTYMPSNVLSGDGSTDVYHLQLLKRDTYETIKQTSIRYLPEHSIVTGFKKPIGVPMYPDEIQGANRINLPQMSRLDPEFQNQIRSNDIFLNDAKAIISWVGPEVSDPDVKMKIQDMIRNSFSSQFRELTVKSIVEKTSVSKEIKKPSRGAGLLHALVSNSNGASISSSNIRQSTVYFVRVIGKGSQFCMNKGSDHSSNSIYFMITPEYIAQKCFSENDYILNGGGQISCKTYRSREVNLPYDLRKYLFPENDVEIPVANTVCISNKSPGITPVSVKRKNVEGCSSEDSKKAKLQSMFLT